MVEHHHLVVSGQTDPGEAFRQPAQKEIQHTCRVDAPINIVAEGDDQLGAFNTGSIGQNFLMQKA
ncbi:hypothetical protein D3C72_2498680 [compost metagenome]